MSGDEAGTDVSGRDVEYERSLQRLREVRAARAAAAAELKEAVRAARESGGSVRAIAEVGHLSTRTVQKWLKGVD